MVDQPPIQIEATSTFNRNIRTLAKKYRNILNDVQPVIEQLEQGVFLGDQIPDVGYSVFKLRIPNRDARKGKSGGYRLIYYLKTATGIILLALYAKSEQVDISADEIRSLIETYKQP